MNRRQLTLGLAAGATLSLAVAAPAWAHVSIAEQEAEAGAFTLLTFGVPHGCEGSPTTRVRIQMPESIPQVTPTVNPGWDVEKMMAALDEPIEAGHGEQITERVSEVVYTAKTPLPDGFRDALVLSLQVPEDAAGTTLYFPTVQECEQGETAWIELPADGQDGEELEAPAPSIAVVAAAPADGDEAANGTEAAADAQEAAVETATSDDGDDDGDGAATGLAIAALVAGVAGLAVGGVALARSRRT
jgi:uncharacterized protein YcnI